MKRIFPIIALLFLSLCYSYGARSYNPITLRWTTQDPMAEKYYRYSPYTYCVNNPVNIIDPNGMDTINVLFDDKSKKWIIDNIIIIITKGDDVFKISNGELIHAIIFYEGKYAERVNALNLENNVHYTLGIYPLLAPLNSGVRWRQVQIGGSVEKRGIKFHYGKNQFWSEGCYILTNDYSIEDRKITFKIEDSQNALENFNKALGAQIPSYSYVYKGKERLGAKFAKELHYLFIQKSLTE